MTTPANSGSVAIVPVPEPDTRHPVDYAAGLALGLADLVATVIEAGRTRGEVHTASWPGRSALDYLPDALLGLGMAAEMRALRGFAALAKPVVPLATTLGRQPIVRSLADEAGRQVVEWGRRGREERLRNQKAANDFVRRLVAAVLEQVDLDSAADRVSVDRIIDRIDLDAVVAGVDLNAVVARIDMPRVAEQFLDEVDLPEIMRESSTSVGAEAVNALRVQGMVADSLLSRIADRVLMRRARRPDRLHDGSDN